MRNSQRAEQCFRYAKSQTWYTSDGDGRLYTAEAVHHGNVAEGLAALSAAIRDIYDKLEAIHKDIRVLGMQNSMKMNR